MNRHRNPSHENHHYEQAIQLVKKRKEEGRTDMLVFVLRAHVCVCVLVCVVWVDYPLSVCSVT